MVLKESLNRYFRQAANKIVEQIKAKNGHKQKIQSTNLSSFTYFYIKN
jgi:hypothetical protein